MRLTLNALIGVILLIFSIILAFIIGTKFFNKQDPCLNSFFSFYKAISDLDDNSYTKISLYVDEKCLIAYYPRTALIFNQNFFDYLRNNKENKNLFDFYRSLLKYPISYGCNDLSSLNGCGNFSNFYSLANDFNYKEKILKDFRETSISLAISIAGFSSLYLKRVLWKKSIDFVKSRILKKIEEKIAEKAVEKVALSIAKKVAAFSIGFVLVANPIGLVISAASLAITAYSTYELVDFTYNSYKSLETIKSAINDYLFFWNNKFLTFLEEKYKDDLVIFYLDDKSKSLLKGKEGSLILCEKEDNICRFNGIYFKKLANIDYVSNSLALIYPIFFENALIYSTNKKTSENYYLFNLNLANNKSLVVVINEKDPYLQKAKEFFELLKNKNLYKLSDLDYLTVVIEEENNKPKIYLLFYGLMRDSKLLNPGNYLVIDPKIDLTNYLDKKVLDIVENNLEQASNENLVVITIEHGVLKIQNEDKLTSFYKKINQNLKTNFNYFVKELDFKELKGNLPNSFTNEEKEKEKELNKEKFLESFAKEKFYKYYIINYLLNQKVDENEFKNVFGQLLKYLDKDNYILFSKNFDLLMIIYSIDKNYYLNSFENLFNAINNEKNVNYDFNKKIEEFLAKKEDKEKFNKLVGELNKIFYSYNIKSKGVEAYDSLNNIIDFILTKEEQNNK